MKKRQKESSVKTVSKRDFLSLLGLLLAVASFMLCSCSLQQKRGGTERGFVCRLLNRMTSEDFKIESVEELIYLGQL